MVRDYHRDPPGQWRRTASVPGAAARQGQGAHGPAAPRRRWVRWAAAGTTAVALAGALWGAGGPSAWRRLAAPFDAARAVLSQGYFRVAEVVVEGNLHLGREDVLAAMGLPDGVSLLALDLPVLAARVAVNPWVKEAMLQRRLPDRLVVRLVERAPAAVLVADAAYLVSGDGVLLEGADDDARAVLPVLRAPAGRRYAVGERVAPQELNEALGTWRQVQIAPALAGRRPQEVALEPDGTYRVQMAPGTFAVRLRADGLGPQFKRLGAVVALRGGSLGDVEEVDLRFPQKVILRQSPVGLRWAAERSGRPPRGPAAGPGVSGPADGRWGAGPVRPPGRVPSREAPPVRGGPGGAVPDVAPDLRLAPRGGDASG